VYFNVNFKTFPSLINSAFFWFVNYIDFRMHGATIKIFFKCSFLSNYGTPDSFV